MDPVVVEPDTKGEREYYDYSECAPSMDSSTEKSEK